MRRYMVVALSLAIITLDGCSKTLTESAASSVIQKWIDSQNGGVVSTSAGALMNTMGAPMVNKWSPLAVQRLLKQGYLEEKPVSVAYPNFSGHYSGRHYEVNMFGIYVSTPSYDTLDIETGSDTRPPHVRGKFTTCFENNCAEGSVSGAVQSAGQSSFILSFPDRAGSLMSNRPGTRNRLLVALERGQPDAIVAEYLDADSLVKLAPISIRATRDGTNPPDIHQDVYVYSWTNKLPNDTFSGTALNLGHLVVESCERLLLISETTATASCKTHVKLTSAAEAIFGSRPTDQLMQASFGKQPDGTWIGTNINYSPPPFSYAEFYTPQVGLSDDKERNQAALGADALKSAAGAAGKAGSAEVEVGRQKRTMADMRSLATAIEAYHVDYNTYPPGACEPELFVEIGPPLRPDSLRMIAPTYVSALRSTDAWEHALHYQASAAGDKYCIVSFGRDGKRDATGPRCGTTTTVDDDIIYSNGMFLQWPAGTQQ